MRASHAVACESELIAAGFHIPNPDGPICRGRHDLRAVRTECGTAHTTLVAPQGRQGGAGNNVPQPDRPVARGGQNGLPIGTRRNCVDRSQMALERHKSFSGRDVTYHGHLIAHMEANHLIATGGEDRVLSR